MTNEFTAVFMRDDRFFVALCPEVPGAVGQGETLEDAREDLIEAIKLILEVRRDLIEEELARGELGRVEHREVLTVA